MADKKKAIPLPSAVDKMIEKYIHERDIKFFKDCYDNEVDESVKEAAKRVIRSRKKQKPKKVARVASVVRPVVRRITRPPVEVELSCVFCGIKFWKSRRAELARVRAGKRGPYCSRDCYYQSKKEFCNCSGCETIFERSSGVRRGNEIYCSKICCDKSTKEFCNCPVCETIFERSSGVCHDEEIYCSKICYDDRFVPRKRYLKNPTYCHHCIDRDATCEVMLKKRWMGLCDLCADHFMYGTEVAVLPGRSLPWAIGSKSKRKPMLYEIERKGAKPTLNTRFMILTLEWMRP